MTAILERAGAETIALPQDERRHARKQLLARYVWEGATTGQVRFPSDTTDLPPLYLKGSEWLDLVKFLYSHIDGPPPAQTQVDGKLLIEIVYGNADPDPT